MRPVIDISRLGLGNAMRMTSLENGGVGFAMFHDKPDFL